MIVSARLWLTLVLALLLGPGRSSAVEEGAANVRWHAVTQQMLEGQGWTDVQSPFDRLPARAERLVRPEVWELARHAAGMNVRFVTDAPAISVRWTLTSERLAMPHMAATGVSGVDLYVKHEGRWRFLAVGRPTEYPTNEVEIVKGLKPSQAEYRLNLPLYNGVSRVEIGVPDDAEFRFKEPSRQAPVVLYGTSITQGGCASRPGMSYAAILSRRLDVPVINLGFSGNGKSEPEVARLLAELNPAIFVLDPLGNMFPEQVAERLPGFIQILRDRHPDVPILLNENVYYPTTRLVPARLERVQASNAILRNILDERIAAGDRRISIIPACDLTVDDGDTTVDGTHPTDHGFLLMADAIEPYLRQTLHDAR